MAIKNEVIEINANIIAANVLNEEIFSDGINESVLKNSRATIRDRIESIREQKALDRLINDYYDDVD
tara:strand:- start:172879 stop:173079 length:201 start_codon:yes stop_codon:yes gene_type:complete